MSVEQAQLNKSLASIGMLDKLAKRMIFSILSSMQESALTLQEGNEQNILGNKNADLQGKVIIHDPRCYKKMLLGGSIGAGEAYIQGLWSSPDLTKVIQVLGRERQALAKLDKRFAAIMKLPSWIYHKARKNTQAGSKKNILAHYDLGKYMYQTFLDS